MIREGRTGLARFPLRSLRLDRVVALAGVTALLFVAGATGKGAVVAPLLVNGTIVTMDDAHHVLRDGHVLVGGDGVIEAVWAGAPPSGVSTAGARVVEAGRGGLVFPGLINVHDHATYAMLPTWPPPRSDAQPNDGRTTGSEPYDFRYEWGGGTGGPTCWPSPPWSPSAEEKRLINNPYSVVTDGDKLGLLDQAIVYAEARAALGGETAVSGEPPDAAANARVVRDVDQENFGVTIESRVKTIDHCFTDAQALATSIKNGQVAAWIVHLAEGVRNGDRVQGDAYSSHDEFVTLRKLRLLTSATVIVHGIALEPRDFAVMHRAGAKLVWSPLSNLLLYGATTDVYDALAARVPVSLGTDWSPTGSGTLLDELKIADITLRDRRLLGTFRQEVPALASDTALDQALIDMVTRNPAQALHWPVGSIEPGKHADLLIIRRPADSPTGGMPNSPYRNLIDATERDVRLVLIDGKPVAGDPAAMKTAGATSITAVHSRIGNYTKGIAFRNGPPPRKLQLRAVERTLTDALAALGGDNATPASGQPPPTANFTYLHTRWKDAAVRNLSNPNFRAYLTRLFQLNGKRTNLERIDLVPLLTDDNHFFFTVVQANLTTNGLPNDPNPPFHPYAINTNQATKTENPFATIQTRWYR
jgi:cytosine/adenosine deaminase-related metal-dependent hydrolase